MSDKPKERKDPPNEVRYTLKPLTTEEALKKALKAKPEPKRKATARLPRDG